MIKWNDEEINKVKETDVSLGLLSGCHRLLKGFIRRRKESEKERGGERNRRGKERMKQEDSFPQPPPLTIALSSPSKEQMPRFPVASQERMSGEK